MINDHIHDSMEDIINKKYNPVVSEVWNVHSIANKLINDIKSVDCEEIDRIMTYEDAKNMWWQIY